MENDGTVFFVDVSHIWYGCLYRSTIQISEKDSCHIAGEPVYDGNLCGRIQYGTPPETL